MGRLAGKVAIVTGAAQGMGAAHARLFVEQGARVVLTDLNADAGGALAAELGAAARFVTHDVASAADWQAVFAAAEAAFGPVTVLVNNAGIIGRAADRSSTSRRSRGWWRTSARPTSPMSAASSRCAA